MRPRAQKLAALLARRECVQGDASGLDARGKIRRKERSGGLECELIDGEIAVYAVNLEDVVVVMEDDKVVVVQDDVVMVVWDNASQLCLRMRRWRRNVDVWCELAM